MGEPRIVLFDLETIPDLQAALKVWPSLSNYPGQTLKASISSICCFGYKVLGEGKTHCISAWDFPAWKKNVNDDRSLLGSALSVLEGADAVITQNGRSFDWRFLQTRLALHNMPSLPKLHHIDTKLEAKRNLYLFSNSLKHMAEVLTDTRKIENEGWDLWVKTWHRDPVAQKTMAAYCRGDVDALEAIYLRLRKYSRDIPNHNLFKFGQGEKPVCHGCGSTRLKGNGVRFVATRAYRRYQCLECGAWTRTDASDRFPRAL